MSPEIPTPQPEHEPFQFSERETLFERVSHARFMQVLEDESTTVIRAEVSSNSFGEFLFVTTGRGQDDKADCLTFWAWATTKPANAGLLMSGIGIGGQTIRRRFAEK